MDHVSESLHFTLMKSMWHSCWNSGYAVIIMVVWQVFNLKMSVLLESKANPNSGAPQPTDLITQV